MAQPEVWLVRHGETQWSRTGRHTGTTDVPLTAAGEDAARLVGDKLAGQQFPRVVTSPMRRSRRTAELAGFADAAVDARLVEWRYGVYEGVTTAETRREIPDFTVWTHPIPDGEELAEVGARADQVITDLCGTDERTLVFSHGHFLRVLTARWLGLPPGAGAHLALHTATVSVLGWERETPVLQRWNA